MERNIRRTEGEASGGSGRLHILVGEPFWERMKGIEGLRNAKPPDRQVLDTLVKAIRHDNSIWVCMKAIKILQRYAPLDSQTITSVLQAYPDESDEVSEKIIEILGQIRDVNHPGVRETLIKVLQQDHSPQVRGAAARALRSLSAPIS